MAASGKGSWFGQDVLWDEIEEKYQTKNNSTRRRHWFSK